jgi:CBS domain-containing protein
MSTRTEEQQSVSEITKASVIIFGVLVGSYVLILWLLPALHAVPQDGDTWWIALVVVLALGAAAGLGYSYQVLKLFRPQDVFKRMEGISAETVARRQPKAASVTEHIGVDEVRRIRSETRQDLIPVIDEESGTLDGVVTSTDLTVKPQAQTVRELMTPEPTVATTKDSLADVLTVMRASGHDNIPVVDEERRYVGTVTPRAMLEALQSGPAKRTQ